MASTETATTEKRNAVAKREWINESGEKVVAGAPTVAGFRYTYLANGKSVEYMISDDYLSKCFSVMGGLTKIGNIVNSVINDDSYDGAADPMVAVGEWLEDASAGVWREPGEGGVARGPKYDKDVLAVVLAATFAGKPGAGDVAAYRARLDDKSYYAKVRNNAQIMSSYMQEMTALGVTAGQDVNALV